MPTVDFVARTQSPLTAAEIEQFGELGLRLFSTEGEQTYRLRGESDAAVADVEALPFVVEARTYRPAFKMQEPLRAVAGTAALNARDVNIPVNLVVSLDPESDPEGTVTELARIGEILESSARRALVRVDAARVMEVTELAGVTAIETEPNFTTNNNVAREITHVNVVEADFGLDGAGEIVGVADSGLDVGVNGANMLADFAGRVVEIRATAPFPLKRSNGFVDGADLNNHGTHVSGSVLGDGANSNGKIRGMAPAARLTFHAMGPDYTTRISAPVDMGAYVLRYAYADGARLHNNSWGGPGDSSYNAYSHNFDDFVRNQPDMLILCAAGNDGPGRATIGAPATAKNCLTVGASESVRPLPDPVTKLNNPQDTDFNPATAPRNHPLTRFLRGGANNADHVASFSSRGPVGGDNGRIKPEIVAPGTWIASCRSTLGFADVGPDGIGPQPDYADDSDGQPTHAEAVGLGLVGGPFFGTWDQNTPDAPAGSGTDYRENYFYVSGTSMATPVTTGSAALLRQYLRQHRNHAQPSAALMKALLINGATVPAGESNKPDNDRGFGRLDLARTLKPAPTGKQEFIDDAAHAVATGELRTFILEGVAAGAPLRVTLVWTDHPGERLHNRLYLRVITPAGDTIDGDIAPFPNPHNNSQRVHIEAPAAGDYTVEVHAIEVAYGSPALRPAIRQDFALAVANCAAIVP